MAGFRPAIMLIDEKHPTCKYSDASSSFRISLVLYGQEFLSDSRSIGGSFLLKDNTRSICVFFYVVPYRHRYRPMARHGRHRHLKDVWQSPTSRHRRTCSPSLARAECERLQAKPTEPLGKQARERSQCQQSFNSQAARAWCVF